MGEGGLNGTYEFLSKRLPRHARGHIRRPRSILVRADSSLGEFTVVK